MIVGVIPARGGSKRVPGKNIVDVAGKPLLAYTIAAAVEGLGAAHVWVSTEAEGIAAISRAAGVGVVVRPVELATDVSSTESALIHALDAIGAEQNGYEWVMTLPPTSPLRDSKVVLDFLARSEEARRSVDCVMTVTENRGDFWRSDGATIRRLRPEEPRRQQDRTPLLEENSAIYLTRISALRATGSILGGSVAGIAIDRLAALDINDEVDLRIVRCLLATQHRR